MGIGFVILVWMLIFSTLGVINALIWFGLVTAAKYSSTAATVKAVYFKALLAIVLVTGIVMLSAFFEVARDIVSPAHVFTKSFGFAPPPDVTRLSGQRFVLGDGGESYLKFYAGSATVERILKENAYVEISSWPVTLPADPEFTSIMQSTGRHIYQSSFAGRSNFYSNRASIAYDSDEGNVYFNWVGID
jgi:hypothetical protein